MRIETLNDVEACAGNVRRPARDYKGDFISDDDFVQADYAEYYVYRCEGGYRVWTFAPLACEVEGMQEVR